MTVTSVGPGDQSRAFHTQSLERVAALPGVSHAAYVWGLPLTGNSWPAEIEVPGRAASSSAIVDRISLPVRSVTEDYFAVMGMRLVEGRLFLPTDNREAPPVEHREPDVRAPLPRVRAAPWPAAPLPRQRQADHDRRVIADTRTERLREAPEPELYASFWQNGAFSKHLVVRATGDPLALAPHVRAAVRGVQPTAAVEHVTTMAGSVAHRPRRRPSRCVSSAASRSWRRCSPWSASTGCCHCRPGRGRGTGRAPGAGGAAGSGDRPGARGRRAARGHRRHLRDRRGGARRPPVGDALVRRGGHRCGLARRGGRGLRARRHD